MSLSGSDVSIRSRKRLAYVLHHKPALLGVIVDGHPSRSYPQGGAGQTALVAPQTESPLWKREICAQVVQLGLGAITRSRAPGRSRHGASGSLARPAQRLFSRRAPVFRRTMLFPLRS